MWITAAALGLLRHGEQDLGRDIQLAAEDYRSRPSGVRRVLLNEEPIYVAGHILGMDVTEVDSLPEDVWGRYRQLYMEGSSLALDRDFLRELPSPGPVDETAPYTLRALGPRSTLGR
jgi:hypothetical protein